MLNIFSVRATEVTLSEISKINVLTDGTINVDCIIVGKPLVDRSTVSWKHEKEGLDLSDFVNTINGSKDKFTLKSTLKMVKPLGKYTENLTCTVKDNDRTISQSVEVVING